MAAVVGAEGTPAVEGTLPGMLDDGRGKEPGGAAVLADAVVGSRVGAITTGVAGAPVVLDVGGMLASGFVITLVLEIGGVDNSTGADGAGPDAAASGAGACPSTDPLGN